MFSNIITQKLYFNEEFILDGSELCGTLLQRQGISESTAKVLLLDACVTRLVFKGEKLISKDIGDWGGEWNLKTQLDSETDFRYKKAPIYALNIIDYLDVGYHHIGGKAPTDFQFPVHPEMPVSCQYIGMISNQDPTFKWLPISKLHLVYPLFASIGPLFIDYSDTLSPQILKFEYFEHTFKCVTTKSYVEFEKLDWGTQKLRTDPAYNQELSIRGFGSTGAPFWIQHPNWPRCPKSGTLMKFVAQLDTPRAKTIEKRDISPDNHQNQSQLDSLNFWGDGTLYIFIEPETKVVCMLIQNT